MVVIGKSYSNNGGFKVTFEGIEGQTWFYGMELRALYVVSVFERATTTQIGRALGLKEWMSADVYLARLRRASLVNQSIPIKGGPAWYEINERGLELLNSFDHPWKDWRPVKDKRPKVPMVNDSDTLGIID